MAVNPAMVQVWFFCAVRDRDKCMPVTCQQRNIGEKISKSPVHLLLMSFVGSRIQLHL
jgi:hypothetical protein